MFSDRFRYAFTVIHVVGRSFHCCVRLSKYRLVLAILNELAWGMPSLLNCVGLAPTYPVMVMRACCCAMIGPFCRIGNKGAAESTDEGAKATCSRRNGLRERGSARLSASLRFRGRTTIPDSTILVQAQPANVDKGRRFGRVVDSRWINLTYPPQGTADICMVFRLFSP